MGRFYKKTLYRPPYQVSETDLSDDKPKMHLLLTLAAIFEDTSFATCTVCWHSSFRNSFLARYW